MLRLRNNELINLNKPSVMGVINMSPNSFYNPAKNSDDALHQVDAMVKAGANFVDVGGEATNPCVEIEKEAPSVQQEIDRLLPVIEAIKQRFPILVSVDTSQPKVMRAVLEAGADMINDQRALRVPGAIDIVAQYKVPVCLMHFFNPQREPGSSSHKELLNTICSDLQLAVSRCQSAGVAKDRIIIDPGFGQGNYGKNTAENFYLLAQLQSFCDLGYPVLVGWSRKSMLGDVMGGAPADKRLSGSIAAAVLAAKEGASIIRVHDVAETVDALTVFSAYKKHYPENEHER